MGQAKKDLKKVFKKMAFVNDNEKIQTVDEETGARLVHRGIVPGERGLHEFLFFWQGEEIKFYAEEKVIIPDNKDEKWEINWEFYRLQFPNDELRAQREEIAERIKQALEVHGYMCFDRYKTGTVEYYYNPR